MLLIVEGEEATAESFLVELVCAIERTSKVPWTDNIPIRSVSTAMACFRTSFNTFTVACFSAAKRRVENTLARANSIARRNPYCGVPLTEAVGGGTFQ